MDGDGGVFDLDFDFDVDAGAGICGGGGEISRFTTVIPRAEKSFTMAAPIPLLPPVTSTTSRLQSHVSSVTKLLSASRSRCLWARYSRPTSTAVSAALAAPSPTASWVSRDRILDDASGYQCVAATRAPETSGWTRRMRVLRNGESELDMVGGLVGWMVEDWRWTSPVS